MGRRYFSVAGVMAIVFQICGDAGLVRRDKILSNVKEFYA